MINRINRLDEKISNKIAAGEVIDRPASVIKELVENSVDAKATSITVEISNAGKTLIRVSDNGIGIHREDLLLAFERHATSKIHSVDDIFNIQSLGFRGEALSSIASVSDVEVITKTRENTSGIKAEFKKGNLVQNQEVGCPQGTTIIVKDLFYNTPARYKFLKSNANETNYISNIVNNLALSHPEIAVRYIVDNKNIFSTQGNGDIFNAIHIIYGREISKNLIEVKGTEDGIILNGYISNMNYSRGNRQLQVFFVNGRYVKSKVLSQGIEMAYKTLLQSNRFPICFLYIDLPYNKVDVNVHPAKTEIRFNNESWIREFIYNSLKKQLSNLNLIPEVKVNVDYESSSEKNTSIEEGALYKNKVYKGIPTLPIKYESKTSDSGNKIIQRDINNINSSNIPADNIQLDNSDLLLNSHLDKLLEKNITIKEEKTINYKEDMFYDLKIIGQLFSTYIVCEQNKSLVLIDQHAAHERILYDKFLDNYFKEEIISQILLDPISIELSYLDKKNVFDNIDFFNSIGYLIEDFGHNTIIIREIPMVLGMTAAKSFIMEVIENVDNLHSENEYEINKIITQACKKAIKANDKLEDIEIDSLIFQLSKLENPFSCPHGRPIFISISNEEIEKKFKRT